MKSSDLTLAAGKVARMIRERQQTGKGLSSEERAVLNVLAARFAVFSKLDEKGHFITRESEVLK